MLMDSLLQLLASIEDIGGFKDVKLSDGMSPQAKLVLDKQSYDVVQNFLAGLVKVDSDTKMTGLCFTIECGDVK